MIILAWSKFYSLNTPAPVMVGQNKETEFPGLVDRYKDVVYNTALSIVQSREDAEDITQEVFLRVYEADNFREESTFSTWIYRVTINTCLDHEKKKKRLKRGSGLKAVFSWSDDKEPKEFYHPGIAAENREQGLILFRAIAKLPDNQKIAFILQRIEGKAVREIAEITGNTNSGVESLLSRAKQNLQKELKTYYENNF